MLRTRPWNFCLMLWLLLTPFCAVAQPLSAPVVSATDTLEIYFRLDSTSIDMSFGDNTRRWQQFEERFFHDYEGRNAAGIQFDIYAGASPEGPASHNRELGEGRGQAIAELIQTRFGGRVGRIEVHNLGPRWDDLYTSVAASHEPWRDTVLSILSMPEPENSYWRGPRERRLRELYGGKVWPELLARYLAPLRSGGTAVVSWHPERDTLVVKDTLVIRDTVVVIHENHHYTYYTPVPVEPEPDTLVPADQTPAWAVKTNFALWSVVAPNVQLELPLGTRNRWSLEVEYFHPWFIWNTNAQASQFLNLGAEIRLWLGNRTYHRWLDGWHIGFAVAGGKYDWEWMTHEGYQGEFLNAYFNFGYQCRLGRHWALDFGIGAGAVASQYRRYYGGSVYPEGREEAWDQHLIWHSTGRLLWPGVTHLNISLVYLFNNRPFHFRTLKKLDDDE